MLLYLFTSVVSVGLRSRTEVAWFPNATQQTGTSIGFKPDHKYGKYEWLCWGMVLKLEQNPTEASLHLHLPVWFPPACVR